MLVGSTPNVIVLGRGVNAKTIPELIALAKARPGGLNYGSAGVGSSSHLAGALFVSKAGIDVVHVPFRIGADSRSALIAGTIQFYVYPLPAIVSMIKAGTLRALAVGSPKRAAAISVAAGNGSGNCWYSLKLCWESFSLWLPASSSARSLSSSTPTPASIPATSSPRPHHCKTRDMKLAPLGHVSSAKA